MFIIYIPMINNFHNKLYIFIIQDFGNIYEMLNEPNPSAAQISSLFREVSRYR